MLTALLLLCAQGLLGAFDTLYYHEYKLRLPQQAHACHELRLHAYRDFIYAIVLCTLGWLTWNGPLALLLLVLLLVEIVITLADFLEEDRTRKLPPGERVMHALMGILFGIFLAHLLPQLWYWWGKPLGFGRAHYGIISWVLTLMGAGVLLSGIRDYDAGRRQGASVG